MRTVLLAAVGFLALSACENPPPEEKTSQSAAIKSDTEGEERERTEQSDVRTCVESCVRDNQMRAEPIEQIREDCREQCE